MTNKQQFHLITPPIADPAAFRPRLVAAMTVVRPVSVHLRVAATDPQLAKRHLQALATVVQDAGAALLIDPPADLREVARLGADGVHVAQPEALDAALRELKPDRIVGAGGLRGRDAAMEAGEAGVDYVMFGEPRLDGSLPKREMVEERCRWWVELFNVPCVAYVPDAAALPVLAATGVEFLAFGDFAFADDDGLATALATLR